MIVPLEYERGLVEIVNGVWLSHLMVAFRVRGLLRWASGEGSWVLAPAFDINPQPLRHRELKIGISEISGFDASVEAWVEAAPFFERTEDEARRLAADMAQAISSSWRSFVGH